MITECPDPPMGEYVTYRISSSYYRNEYWTDTEVKYECNSSHALIYGEVDTRTCGRNRMWDQAEAPECAPGVACFSFTTLTFKKISYTVLKFTYREFHLRSSLYFSLKIYKFTVVVFGYLQ